MSGEKENLKKLVERIDELLVVLNRISEDLRSLSASTRSMVSSQIAQPVPQAPTIISHEVHEKEKSRILW